MHRGQSRTALGCAAPSKPASIASDQPRPRLPRLCSALSIAPDAQAIDAPTCSFPATGPHNGVAGTLRREQATRAIVALRELSRATSANHRGRFVDRRLQKSLNAKRSVVIGRHKTSVSLEDAFWKAFNEIAASRNMTLSDLLARIDTGRHYGGLSSAIRLFVLAHYRAQVDARKSAERPIDEKSHSAHRVA